MTHLIPSIELNIAEKLQDPDYRRKFFIAESSAEIARQLVRLRKLRKLSQKQLAEKAGMAQPRISKVERADYENWSFNTLRRLAEAMDARIRVLIEPAEDVLFQYQTIEKVSTVPGQNLRTAKENLPPVFDQSLPKISIDQVSRPTQNRTGGAYGLEVDRQQPRNIADPSASPGRTNLPADGRQGIGAPLPIPEVSVATRTPIGSASFTYAWDF
jgi:transcriptional regulator with XRE-family HTH domain